MIRPISQGQGGSTGSQYTSAPFDYNLLSSVRSAALGGCGRAARPRSPGRVTKGRTGTVQYSGVLAGWRALIQRGGGFSGESRQGEAGRGARGGGARVCWASQGRSQSVARRTARFSVINCPLVVHAFCS